MCVAYPGKVLHLDGRHAQVDFSGNIVKVNVSMVPVQVGDYVLVHAGMAIQKVEREEGRQWQELFREIGEAADD
ncbi:MAG: HypC/HybG/HupF family hydrogenase formation chaperone [Acidaminococcaceae bacterium]|nr:HypC/HybG/HupF family hydrogenase formation chaperone [Acidaminococcaceae bacterium]